MNESVAALVSKDAERSVSTFQETRDQAEQTVVMNLLNQIDRNPALTQRSLATELGVALGLMNYYLKRCIAKGWVRVSKVSARRLAYFLTPQGFLEKKQMVTSYLERSLTFFRDARVECEAVFQQCQSEGLTHMALVGAGDLADIAKLVAQGMSLTVDIVGKKDNLTAYDAVLVTDISDPQGTYEWIKAKIAPQKLFILDLLHISKGVQ